MVIWQSYLDVNGTVKRRTESRMIVETELVQLGWLFSQSLMHE